MSLVRRLPDELWTRIMEIGIQSKTLDSRNLCSISIACRRLRRLASQDPLWSLLLLSHFPSSGDNLTTNKQNNTTTTFKTLYKMRYTKDREQKRLAHRRVVLRIESEIAERLRKIQEIELRSSEEKEKMNEAVSELLNLHRARQASVALNVWQPEVVRGRQRQLVQQSNVSVDFRINALEMEINLCKKQIAGFDKAFQVENRRLHETKEQLASVNYHPLQDFPSTSFQRNECRVRSKKLKT